MAVTSWIRRQFKNGVITTATTTMASGATSFTVNTGAGATFPDGSVGPFIVTVDQAQAAEEKILCSARATDTFTVAASGRGYNGTSAQAHTNAVVTHTVDAQDFDEANQVAVQTLGAVAAAGDLLVGSAANTLAKLAKGATNTFLQAGSSTLQWTAFGVSQSATVAAANADGSQTTPARSDHAHSGVATFNTRNGAVTPGNADYLAVATGGLTGAVAATRYVGGTASGAPGSGTFAVGDFVIDQTGIIWVCTTAGTPGTWSQVGGATDAAWTSAVPLLTNSWTNNGGGFLTVGYRKVGGRVYLRGAVTGGTSGTQIFPLPAAYRPSGIIGDLNSGQRIQITGATGAIAPASALGNTFVCLDNISFDTL